ncbi:hypothetical protein SUGI_0143860 [Cryptomeria japonica]|nr:hypothetical protein SUGI_0143860 [Cryptomeria japonica]
MLDVRHTNEESGCGEEGCCWCRSYRGGGPKGTIVPLSWGDLVFERPSMSFDAETIEEVKENELYFVEMGLIGRF